ncbi:response regulator receiver domain-containing protein [Isoalcanivorax pacificus W11-5]|uniref:Response regulator receiver domain-containing protein n=1 Tax=Isoalcanivorax pacificus W11-5 TaxID=391936 RepID=A0A0B4XTT2_9GAMM|nr:response regulator [Isoalcanivorax pacificus]AJD50105.1 response regulator receiver domain-containing protein [Isoalcanivorax pacificus W11-5]
MQQKATVLFVDDEARILRTLALAFGARYRVLTANSGREAIDLLRDNTVQVVVSDQRMPQMTGVEVLRQARDMQPSAMRILLTGYAELTSIVGSINDGEIFRYVQKPWQLDTLRDTIAEAVEIARQSEQPEEPVLEQQEKEAGGILVLDRTADLFELIQASEPGRPVYTAGTLDEALAHMATHPPALLVTDLQLPEGDISDALRLLKARQPELVTIVVTAFRDTSHLIRLINQAQVYRVLPRPVSRNMLLRSIDSALKHHALLRARPSLLQRHKVEAADDIRVDSRAAGRVRSYLDRLRGRPAPV